MRNPVPNKEKFIQVIKGNKIEKKVPFIELIIGEHVLKYVTENFLNKKWNPSVQNRNSIIKHVETMINCWYYLGYDYIRLTPQLDAVFKFERKFRETKDTASDQKRHWTEEGTGVISNWEDFEKYVWPDLDDLDFWMFKKASALIPDGMGLIVCPSSGFLEIPLNGLFGYENLSYLMHDNPELVEKVFNKVGNLLVGWYQRIIDLDLDNLIGFFQGDDMGYKTSTLVSPDFLRKHVLPWHKKLALLAHDNNLFYLLHACGNLDEIMDDLINDVKIDGYHSFEDEIQPVTEFSNKYSKQVTPLGGIDVDKLTRYNEEKLRNYVDQTLNQCIKNGPYALGSGNSIANYIPVKNYLTMLDEGLKWSKNNLT